MADFSIGVISDTHGLLRPSALAALTGSDLIIHAGDIGRPEILEQLGQLAPVRAVRGNNDRAAWAEGLAERETVQIGEVRLYVLHNLKQLELDPAEAGLAAVVSGHSHKPAVAYRGNVLLLNPGSAGPRRFKLPISVARLEVRGRQVTARLIELEA